MTGKESGRTVSTVRPSVPAEPARTTHPREERATKGRLPAADPGHLPVCAGLSANFRH
ncbi:hypothetical protein [Azospirillum endophyticum]